jgi:hypothetical protein
MHPRLNDLTKQRYLIDLPAGAVLGWVVFQFFRFVD